MSIMENSKSAEMVELHDAGVVITISDYRDGRFGWQEFPDNGWE